MLGVMPSDITVEDVANGPGGITVTFEVSAPDSPTANALANTLQAAISANLDMTTFARDFPPQAVINQAQATTIDPVGSSVQVVQTGLSENAAVAIAVVVPTGILLIFAVLG